MGGQVFCHVLGSLLETSGVVSADQAPPIPHHHKSLKLPALTTDNCRHHLLHRFIGVLLRRLGFPISCLLPSITNSSTAGIQSIPSLLQPSFLTIASVLALARAPRYVAKGLNHHGKILKLGCFASATIFILNIHFYTLSDLSPRSSTPTSQHGSSE
jgi:hypothetical protein